MTNAIDLWISDVLQSRGSQYAEPVVGPINDLVAAWQLVNSAIIGGLFLPLAGGTMTGTLVAWSGGNIASPSITIGSVGMFPDAGGVGYGAGGAEFANLSSAGLTVSVPGGGTVTIAALSEGVAAVRSSRFSNDVTGSLFSADKARGTIQAPAVVALNDNVGMLDWRAYTGSGYVATTRLVAAVIDPAPGPTAMGMALQVAIAPIGSITRAAVVSFAAHQASNAAVTVNAPLFTAGTGTTTVPMELFQESGTTAVTSWTTNGTYIGINAKLGFVGNLIDFHVNGGASVLSVAQNGALTLQGSVLAGNAAAIGYSARSLIRSPADGIFTFSNNAATDFSRLQLGGTTNAFPSIKRNGAGIDFRLADDSGYASIAINGLTINTGSLLSSSVALSNNAAAALGTLTNAPVAGNPTKWIPINDNGTIRNIPAW